jgi:hydroxymethylbilane synthase
VNLRIATRGSALALWQARRVAARLEAAHAGVRTEIVVVRTTGDRVTNVPLSQLGSVGIFTREVDVTVLDGQAEMAVHSLKDVPTQATDRLQIAAVLEREDPRDALVVAPGMPRQLELLPAGARVGTSALRRRALLLSQRPDLVVDDLRGNLDTRLARIAAGEHDAAILACAGIRRLERTDSIAQVLGPPDWLPAPGQGAIAVVISADDERTARVVRAIDDRAARVETTAERSFLRSLQGGCQVPIGALARITGSALTLHGFVASVDGRAALRASAEGDADRAEELGVQIAHELLERGAAELLAGARSSAKGVPEP